MKENITAREIIEQLVKEAGVKKRMASRILRLLPEIIEEGLKNDGEVRVRGLGTFRLKWTWSRPGRKPKTGEKAERTAQSKIIFIPESSFKDYVNRDYRLLDLQVIPEAVPDVPEEMVEEPAKPEPAPVSEPVYESAGAAEPVREPEVTPPPPPTEKRKKRIHWIVPAAIILIVILGIIFYFRNFYESRRSDVESRQEMAKEHPELKAKPGGSDGSWQSAPDSGQLAASNEPSAVDSSKMQPDTVQSSKIKVQSTEAVTQNSELKTQNSELRTQNSELKTLPEGSRLFQLARDAYGNPYLWVLIYKENKDKINNPDTVVSGIELKIPKLEGTPGHLSRNDSAAVAEGYRLLYEFYNARGDDRAKNFLRGSKKYKPF